MKVAEENFHQILRKVLCLWRKQIFVYIVEDFAINLIGPKFLSLLMTGIIRKGVTERVSFKNIRERCLSRSSKAVHNKTAVNILRSYRVYAEST